MTALNISSTLNLDPGYDSYIDGTSGLIAKLGRNFAGIRKNYGPDDSPIISPEITYAIQHGRTWIYQNGKPNPIAPDTDTSGTYWRSIAAGHYDHIYTAFFAAVKADPRFTTANPLRYSPHHEQTALSEPPAAKGAGTAADFKAFFQHVHALCVSSGAHISAGGNIALCLVPDVNQVVHDPKYGTGTPSSATAAYQISLLDPGPGFYDLCGMDFYIKTTSGTSLAGFTALHKWAQAVGKPWITGETGIASAKNPPLILPKLLSLLKGFGGGGGPGECEALCWTSRIASGGDFRMDANSAILAAYKQFVNDPYFT